MYCEDSAGTAIEHFHPKAAYPGLAFQWKNYLWACSHCNSNLKRDQFPLDRRGLPLLIDPTSEDPLKHLVLSVSTGEYVALDVIGDASIRVFGLNREICVRGRLMAWTCLQALIRDYERGSVPKKRAILRTLSEFPFQGVRKWLAVIVTAGDPANVVPEDVASVVDTYPELMG